MQTGSIRLDVATAYVVTAARVGAWAVVSALVYRRLGAAAFAVLALVRATAGLLSYTSLGLAPAMVRFLAEADKPQPVSAFPPDVPAGGDAVLHYALPATDLKPEVDAVGSPAQRVYASGERLSLLLALLGLVASGAYCWLTGSIHRLPPGFATDARVLAFGFGVGIVLRVVGEVPGALLQVRGGIALDNVMQAAAECVWLGLSAAWLLGVVPGRVGMVGVAFALSSALLLLGRRIAVASNRIERGVVVPHRKADPVVVRRLLGFGLAITLAQAADFLYAPTDYLLIDWLIDTKAVAAYAPAVQIDAGLLFIVAAVANVLLPRAAVAHAAGDVARVRAYYVRGTLVSLAALSCAALAVWLASPLLLRLWLGSDLPATRAILPWVLVHTVVGGSGAVGRSVLLATGKVKPFTTAVIVAGLANVLLSYTFVRFFGMGLHGIVLGTIMVVVARSGIWTPWYVLRTLRREAARGA